jgi:pimeloyl-ACP methyl ester carboxylesterase
MSEHDWQGRALSAEAERDRLRERIDAYEGEMQAWEEMDRAIRESSLGTPAAQSLAERTPWEVGRAIVLGARHLDRAEKAEAERDQLRDQALPEAAAIMNRLSTALGAAEAERDRLRAVVDAARRLLRTNTTTDADTSLVAEIDHWALVALDDALHGLDVSTDMDGSDWDAAAGEKP